MIPDDLNADLSACSLVGLARSLCHCPSMLHRADDMRLVVAVIVTVAVKLRIVVAVVEGVLVEGFVALELVVDAFHFVSHVQVHTISDLAGDVVEAGHKTLEIFHVGCFYWMEDL
jgi:hypothetical protein